MKGKVAIIALSILTLPMATSANRLEMAVEAQASTPIRQQMDWLHRTKNVNFVYDSSLDVDVKYQGPSLQGM